MKKFNLSFWLLLAAATTIVLFNSCGKDEPEIPQEIAVTGISLNKATLILAIGESEILVATVTPENATDKAVTWESGDSSIAIVDVDGKVTAVAEGTVTIIAKAGDKTAECVVAVINPLTHDEGVEVNGIRWATRNVDMPGTFAQSPESSGMFYQWNRKIGWSGSEPLVNSDGDTEWNSTSPQSTEWEQTNDPCPRGWRVPTFEEIQTLDDADNVYSEWTNVSGISGRTFTDRANNNSIFLPAMGARSGFNGASVFIGNGLYWSRTFSGAFFGFSLSFNSTSVSTTGMSAGQSSGFSVRCVAE